MNKKTIRIAGWALGLSMAIAGIGAAAINGVNAPFETKATAPEGSELIYTLDPETGTDNGYATNEDIEIDGITWNVTGNATLIPWRIGGKSLSGIDRSVYSKTAIPEDVSYIEIDVGAADSVTVNSMKVGVYSTADKAAAGGNGDIATFTPSFEASSTIEIAKADSSDWSGCFYNITFNVSIGSKNKFIEFSEVRFYTERIPLTGISSVSLSKSTAPANYSKNDIIATATYTPDGTANERIVWTSSNSSIATIAAGDAYNTAVIRPVSVGTVHFTAANQSGTITCNSADFVVTEALVQKYYQITFAEQATDSNVAFTDAASATAKLRGDVDGVSVSSTSYVYSGANDTFKFGGSSTQGSLTFATDEDVKTIIIEAKSFGTDTTEVVPTLAKGESATAKDAVELTSDFKYYTFNYASAGDRFTIAASGSSKKRFYLKSITFILNGYADAEGAFGFAAKLLNDTSADCASKNASGLATSWGLLSTAYDTAESTYSGTKTFFKNLDKDENGNIAEKGAARYDYIVGKYLKTLGNPAFIDFADRDPADVNGLGSSSSTFNLDSNYSLSLIAVVALAGVATAGGLFFLQRKHRNED